MNTNMNVVNVTRVVNVDHKIDNSKIEMFANFVNAE